MLSCTMREVSYANYVIMQRCANTRDDASKSVNVLRMCSKGHDKPINELIGLLILLLIYLLL